MPSGNDCQNSELENGHSIFVSFPKNGGCFHSYVSLYQRVFDGNMCMNISWVLVGSGRLDQNLDWLDRDAIDRNPDHPDGP